MNLISQKNISILLGLGSILFLIAAFLPYSRIFAEPSPEKKMEIILAMKTQWIIAQVFFGLGAVLVAAAFGFLTFSFKNSSGITGAKFGFYLLIIGALLWCWLLTERLLSPELFAKGKNTPYLFLIYSFFTQAGLILTGIVIINSAMANWIGWMFIIGAGLFFVLLLVFKDMPPFVYYLLTLIASVAIFLKSI